MPVVPEMRVIWDAMRPDMQNVMNGVKTPAEAARGHAEGRRRADRGHEGVSAGTPRSAPRARSPTCCCCRPLVAMLLVVLFPLLYNFYLAFRNMSLYHFTDHTFVGLAQFRELFSQPVLYVLFGKSLLWTALNLVFHVTHRRCSWRCC